MKIMELNPYYIRLKQKLCKFYNDDEHESIKIREHCIEQNFKILTMFWLSEFNK